MGRLAGFLYREIVKRLKRLASHSTAKPPEVMKFGSMPIPAATPPSPTIPAICPKERCGRSLNKQGSAPKSSCRSKQLGVFSITFQRKWCVERTLPGWIGFGGPVLKSGDPVEQLKQVKYMDLVANVVILHNVADLPNYGERFRQGERISTGFVESTVNQVASKRMVKRQQMQWSQRGAHLLLQTRTRVLNGDLEETFRGWYPEFRPPAPRSTLLEARPPGS